MKSNRGMTIVSLLVYIIVLTIVIGTISMLMKYFYRNENETVIQKNTSDEYARFVKYIADDINSEKIDTVEIVSSSDIKLHYKDGTVHEYQLNNKKLYNIVLNETSILKKIELCSEVTNCLFSYNSEQNRITTMIIIGGTTYNNNFTVK